MGRVGVGRAVRDSRRANQLGDRDLEDAFATGCLPMFGFFSPCGLGTLKHFRRENKFERQSSS